MTATVKMELYRSRLSQFIRKSNHYLCTSSQDNHQLLFLKDRDIKRKSHRLCSLSRLWVVCSNSKFNTMRWKKCLFNPNLSNCQNITISKCTSMKLNRISILRPKLYHFRPIINPRWTKHRKCQLVKRETKVWRSGWKN